jgi:hypothetical protein
MSNRNRQRFDGVGKKLQADFRDTSETISTEGRSPLDDKGLRNRHLLALGYEQENLYPALRGDDGAVGFFRSRGIKWWKSARSGDNAKVAGPTRNMASSQVACVNYLLPLAGIPGALSAALRAIDDDVLGVVEIHHNGNASPLEFEWIGIGGSLEGAGSRGANSTSVDAFLIAETRAGRRAYLLEWKYVEQYLSTRPDYKGKGRSGDTRRLRYSDRYHAESSSFDLAVVPDMDEFLYEPFYQLMRQRLLADRMVQQSELDVVAAKVVVTVPDQNWAYRSIANGSTTTSPPLAQRFPDLATVKAVMRTVLKNPNAHFSMVDPSTLVDAVEREWGDNARVTDWAAYLRERYGV